MPLFPPSLQTPAPAQAPTPKPAPATPDLPPGFKPEFRFIVRPWAMVDLGSVGPTEKAQRQWEVENRSDAPIAFKVADLAPGVLVPGDPFKDPIAPHAKRAFTIQVDATGWEGYQRRGIRLVSDDPKQPSYDLYLDWSIKLPVMPVPSRVVFDDPKVAEATLRLEGDKPFKILSADLQAEGFELGPVPKGEAKAHALKVRRVKAGAKDGFLVLTLSGVDDPVKVPVIWADPSRK